jgi:antitoxin component YwqK of YwqJK toxin-antitoxin module
MLRISSALLFTIFSFILFGQDTVNVTDVNGRRQGYWRKTDSAGKLVYTGRFRDGLPDGEFRYYYPDGRIKTVSIMSNHGKRAVTVSYFPNGKKMAVGNYLHEKRDSTWQFFSEYDGALVSLETYQSGVITGQSKIFLPEGGLSEIFTYKDGLRDGPWEQYFPDGKVKLTGVYQAGEKHGPLRVYYDSGRIMVDGGYNHGHRDGAWFYYDEKGNIDKKEIYSMGQLKNP